MLADRFIGQHEFLLYVTVQFVFACSLGFTRFSASHGLFVAADVGLGRLIELTLISWCRREQVVLISLLLVEEHACAGGGA